MITLLIGKKGSGKTKKLIELANEAVQNSNGNVVVIEKGLKLTYDISHKARLVDSDAYGIEGLDALVGFVSGAKTKKATVFRRKRPAEHFFSRHNAEFLNFS